MAIEEIKDPEDTEKTVKKSGMSTMVIVIIAVTVSILLGGSLVGGTFYFVSSMNGAQTAAVTTATDKKADETDEEEDEEDEDEEEDEELAPPKYQSMDPAFIVSFSNQASARFMQFSLEVMTRDEEVIKQLDEHMPVIRSSLLMLFGGQQYEKMVTREGKEKLLREATEDINLSLKKVSGNKELTSLVEAAYFTAFVIQ